ncbi:uncharacterized protein LOC128852563 [Cuculus canorus]|uniref:uncharacterized protein LOC128852563 n=1 Tax=Cuculus canorus TaxID=55661 RepID=UPI0023AB32D1|nr:uncharacterized protein LOC128852563 [Cuculus canorus]
MTLNVVRRDSEQEIATSVVGPLEQECSAFDIKRASSVRIISIVPGERHRGAPDRGAGEAGAVPSGRDGQSPPGPAGARRFNPARGRSRPGSQSLSPSLRRSPSPALRREGTEGFPPQLRRPSLAPLCDVTVGGPGKAVQVAPPHRAVAAAARSGARRRARSGVWAPRFRRANFHRFQEAVDSERSHYPAMAQRASPDLGRCGGAQKRERRSTSGAPESKRCKRDPSKRGRSISFSLLLLASMCFQAVFASSGCGITYPCFSWRYVERDVLQRRLKSVWIGALELL